VIDGAPSVPRPLTETRSAPRLSAAEEARTLVSATNIGSLASLTEEGDPWASMITYGVLGDGSPVLCVSRLAEHGRNLDGDGRGSIVITQPEPPADPLAAARVTLAGRFERPGDEAEHSAARTAHLGAVPAAKVYVDFSDFSLWIMRVQRVRWVGGYGRMDSATASDYAAADADPILRRAASAVAHLNADHADALLTIAQTLGGYPDARAATCTSIDRYGLDLTLDTARGRAPARVAFPEALTDAAALRAATVELTRRARELL
jgi:putative heme iron utilization protein